MGLRRKNIDCGSDYQGWPFADEVLVETHPDLVDFLSATTWSDAVPRQTGTLGISVDQGTLRARLCDRDAGQVCFLTAQTFRMLLDLCDAAARGEAGDWREDRYAVAGADPKPQKRDRR